MFLPGFDPADPYVAYGADRLAAFVETVQPSAAPGARHDYSNAAVGALGYALADRFATGHDGAGAPTAHWTLQDATVGAGGLRSTAADVLTLVEAAIRPQSTPLADAFALTLQPRVSVSERMEQGLGWFLLELNGGNTMAFHDGGTGGFASFAAALPQDRIGLVILTNRTTDASALAFDVLGRLRNARAGIGG